MERLLTPFQQITVLHEMHIPLLAVGHSLLVSAEEGSYEVGLLSVTIIVGLPGESQSYIYGSVTCPEKVPGVETSRHRTTHACTTGLS